MGILLTATVLLVFTCLAFGSEVEIVMENEPQTMEDIASLAKRAAEKLPANQCITQKTCGDCIRAHPTCAWCALQDMNYTAGGKKRCNSKAIIRDECGEQNMVYIESTRTLYDSDDLPLITFAVDNAPDNVQVSFFMSCSENKPFKMRNFCKDVKKWDHVQFRIFIKLLSCPENRDEWNRTIRIHELRGVDKSLFIMNLHMLCECDCEKPQKLERNSPKCSGRGTYHCGICSCPDNRYGKECECEGKRTGDTDDDDKACIAPGDKKICSGRGRCHCGICECFNKTSVSGRFCECDACPRSEDGQICGGKDRGKCVCGKCECTDEWTGPACDCKKGIEACRSPYNLEICHGAGECKCGRCHCFEKDGILRGGRFCEDCPICPLQCERFRRCVRCRNFY